MTPDAEHPIDRTAPSLHAGDGGVGSLLARVRAGDREAAAQFVTRFEPQLRRRIRERLHRELRPVFDSQDIFSTVCRRFDIYVSKGRVKATSLGEVISLLQVMAHATMIDKARVHKRALSLAEEEPILSNAFSQLAEVADDAEFQQTLERCAAALRTDIDREILHFWLMGLPHNTIAEMLGLEHASVRKRWQIVKERLRVVLSEEEP